MGYVKATQESYIKHTNANWLFKGYLEVSKGYLEQDNNGKDHYIRPT